MQKRPIGLAKYSKAEIEKFDQMHAELTAYNQRIGTNEELPMPKYSDNEVAELSGYRQMVIAKECEG